jgi:hypothetical protein
MQVKQCSISIDLEKHSRDLFSVDTNGREVTLGEYIHLHERSRLHKAATVGSRSSERNMSTAQPRPRFTPQQINQLVDQYLASMKENEVMEIAGRGAFNAAELRKAVRERTSVGREIIEMVLADRDYVESQIRGDNYDAHH